MNVSPHCELQNEVSRNIGEISPTRYLALWFILAGMVSKGSRSIKFRSTKASGEGFEIVLARSRRGDLSMALLPGSGEVSLEDDEVLAPVFAAPGEFFAG